MPERSDLTFRPAAGLAKALTVFLWLSVAGTVWTAAATWYRLLVQDHAYGSGGALTVNDWSESAIGLAATVLFIMWLWRVRSNAEFLCRAAHRRGRGWVVGAWFVPVINLWWPKQIVDDVVAASDPRTRPFSPNLNEVRPTRMVLWWWLSWLAANLIGIAGICVQPYPDALESGAALAAAILLTLAAALTAVSAWLAVRVIERIGHDQSSRPPIAWWASDQHLADDR